MSLRVTYFKFQKKKRKQRLGLTFYHLKIKIKIIVNFKILVFNQISILTESFQGPHEKRLLNHLLASYNTLERPVANESEPLEVKFGLTLQQIIDVVS